MDSGLIAGLQISLAGLSLTFLALALLILVMILLVRIFPEKPADGQDQAVSVEPLEADEARRQEIAAALAVGICLLENQDAAESRDPSLGRLLE